jgi:hypothetical protein
VAGDLEHQPPGQVVLGEHALGQVVTAAEREVAGPDQAVRLGQAHLGVVEQHPEQRPFPVRAAQRLVSRRVRGDRGEPAAQAEPPRQVQPGLRPGEHPGDRPQVGQVHGGLGTR